MEGVLERILIDTYNPDQALRLQAEQNLGQFLLTPHAIISLISYVGNPSSHRELRQATAIVIKNQISEFWKIGTENEPAKYQIDANEKEEFRERLMIVLLNEQDNSIRGLLAESFQVVARFDYPHNWSNLLPFLLTNMDNPDVLKVYNSLLALRKLVKRYEYRPKDERTPLHDIIQSSFPFLQTLMTHIITNQSIEAAMVMRMCLKIFWSATVYKLPTVQGVDVNLWFQFIAAILDKKLPEASEGIEPFGQPVNLEERKSWPWWKLKKWAARIIALFIQRYGNPKYAEEEYAPFAEYFRSNTALAFIGPILNNLLTKAQGGFITQDVHKNCLAYLSNCVEMSPTFKLLKPQLDFILFQVVFPALCLSDEDIRHFGDDPVEFVRKKHDPLEDWLDPCIAATTLLQMLARYRQKDVMPKLLTFLQGILYEYVNAPPELRNYKKKDGVLVCIASLSKILMESKTYSSQLVPFLINHMIPEFQSPVAFIRYRTCWAIEYFDEIDWTINNGSTLQQVLTGLLGGLRDPAVPVQAAAACSLRLLIAVDGATDLLRPVLAELVREYFRIMSEVDNESVLSALQAIVNEFGSEIGSIAPTMAAQLINTFDQYAGEGGDDDEAAFNATQCLDTLGAVLEAVEEHPEIISQLEIVIMPMLQRIMGDGTHENYEYLENVVNMITQFTYYPDTISELSWTLCAPFLVAVNEWAVDYVSEIMNPILNYMSKGMSVFLNSYGANGEPLIILLLKAVDKIFENNSDCENERDSKAAANILSCLVICAKNCAPGIDELLPKILLTTIQRMKTCRTKSLTIKLLEVIMASIYYNAVGTLMVLGSDGEVFRVVFSKLFELLPVMEQTFTERLIVLSFLSILTLPMHQLPELLKTNLFPMFQQIIREISILDAEEAELNEIEKKCEDEEDEGDDEDGDDKENNQDDDDDDEEGSKPKGEYSSIFKALQIPDGGYDEDQDCDNFEDETYRDALQKLEQQEKVKSTKYIAGESVDDDEDEEDYSFTSPIENVDLAIQLFETMKILRERGDEPLIITMQDQLDETDRNKLHQLMLSRKLV